MPPPAPPPVSNTDLSGAFADAFTDNQGQATPAPAGGGGAAQTHTSRQMAELGFARVCAATDLKPNRPGGYDGFVVRNAGARGLLGAVNLGSTSAESGWAGLDLAIFRIKGEYFAVQNTCPHAAAPLASGDIEDFPEHELKGCVSCPAHSYIFNLESGACLTNPETPAARVYEVRLAEEAPGVHAVFVSREQRWAAGAAPSPERLEKAAVNSIQLKLVGIGLDRKYGPEDEDGERDL